MNGVPVKALKMPLSDQSLTIASRTPEPSRPKGTSPDEPELEHVGAVVPGPGVVPEEHRGVVPADARTSRRRRLRFMAFDQV